MAPEQNPYPLPVGVPPPPPPYTLAHALPQGSIATMPTGSTRAPRTRWAVFTLLFLASICGETIATANTPPIKYILQPATFFFLLAFYGTGILLVREIARRRQLGWGGYVLLGTAFAFFNEGVVAGTWYTVKPDGYAFILGIDWGWALMLTIFHITFSTVVPIALTEVANPRVRNIPWLNNASLVIITIIFLLTSALGLTIHAHQGARALVYLLGVNLGLLSLAWPPQRWLPTYQPAPGLWSLRWAGFGGTVLYFVAAFLVPGILNGLHLNHFRLQFAQLIIIASLLGVFSFGLATIIGWSSRVGWTPRHTLALVTGALIPCMLLDIGYWYTGEILAQLAMIGYLIWLARRTAGRTSPGAAHVNH